MGQKIEFPRVAESARVSSRGSVDSREINWAWAGLGTVMGNLISAAGCFDQNFNNLSYYIFKNSDLTLSSWTYYGEKFSFADLPNNSSYPSGRFLTEFDWAMRADGTIVAVVTPANVQGAAGVQYGCVAVNFNLAPAPTAPFGTVIATLTDVDTPASGPSEAYGPNGCTYEPPPTPVF